MRFIQRMEVKLRRWHQANKYRDQKIFWADTIAMPRFWLALVGGVASDYWIGDNLGIDYTSYLNILIAIPCFLVVYIILDKILDWLNPIS